MDRRERDVSRFLRGNVFRQFEMHRARTLFGRDAKGVPDQGRNTRCAYDLLCLFRERGHRGADIKNLEMGRSAVSSRLLAGDQHHRHATKKPVSSTRHQVERAGTKCAERYPRLSREPPICGCQERRRLFMTGYYQLDRGLPKTLDDVEVLLAGYSENPINALVLEGSNEKIRSLHFRSLLCIQESEKYHLVKSRPRWRNFRFLGENCKPGCREGRYRGPAISSLQIDCSEMP